MDPVLRYCAVGRQLGYATYLTLDAVTFVGFGYVIAAAVLGTNGSVQLDATGIRPLASAKRLQKEAYRAWFAGLAFNTIAGFYTLWQLRHKEENTDRSDGEGVVESKKLAR